MAESSLYWTTNATGDGVATGYTMAQVIQNHIDVFQVSPATEGVLKSAANELAVAGTATPVTVNTGSAWVHGFFYRNSASVNVTVATPIIGTTGHRVVLRASWAAQTVRIALLSGADAVATPPAVTQVNGTTWEISLATLTITTGAVITVTDARAYCHGLLMVNATHIDDAAITAAKIGTGAVTVTKLGDNAVETAKINALAVTAAKLAANAVETAKILDANVTEAKIGTGAVTETKIGTGAVTEAKIGSAAVTATKIGTGAVVNAKIGDAAVNVDKIGGGAVTEPKIGTNAVTEAKIYPGAVTITKIGDDAVDDTKAGNRVARLPKRQGASTTTWDTPGTTTYTPTGIIQQCGAINCGANAYADVTFPQAFSYVPLAFAIGHETGGGWGSFTVSPKISNLSATGFRVTNQGGLTGVTFLWFAVGPE